MEENNRVVVFEKKELVLVVILIVILLITSFTVGVRLGKQHALKDAKITTEDVKAVELKSTVEEDADATVAAESQLSDEEKLKKLMDESKNRLSNELEKFSSEEKPATENSSTEPKSANAGKFTIQLGSYNTMDEAKQFAEGFTVRGYSPIINEVKIEGKGTWYRVSLGIFATVEEAKKYIKDEQSLFAGQDHVISEIP